jgi:hypothetical protein
MTGGDAHPETRRMMETAIRRLNILEYVILGVAMVLALLAGSLAAWMVENLTGAPFRLTWAVSSLLFFIVPGWMVLRRERRAGTDGTIEPADTDPTGDSDAMASTAPRQDITEKRDDGGR